MFKYAKGILGSLIAAAALTAIISIKAEADSYPGNKVTFSAGTTNTRQSLFTLTNDTLTVNGDPTEANKWYVTSAAGVKSQLVGIRSIFLVTSAGASTGITPVSGSGYIAPSSTSPVSNRISWVTGSDSNSGIGYWDDNASGKGFPNGSHYIEIGNPTSAGKTGVGTDPFGSFKFSGPLVDAQGNPKYDLGMDIMIGGATGSTQRVWFSLPSPKPVPEAGTVITFALLGCMAMLVLRRKRAAVQVEDC